MNTKDSILLQETTETATNRPLLSICIPTYNRCSELKKTIETIIPQATNDIEIIISDNASTDKTEEFSKNLAQNRPNIRYYRKNKNIGPDRNFDFLLSTAKGRFVMLLGDDDRFVQNALALICQTIKQNINTGLIFLKQSDFENCVRKYEGEEIKNIFPEIGIWWTNLSAFIMNDDSLKRAKSENDFSLFYDTYLFQTYVFFKILQCNKTLTIISQKTISEKENGIPGSYNFYDTFIYAWHQAIFRGAKTLINYSCKRKTFGKTLHCFLPVWIVKIRYNSHSSNEKDPKRTKQTMNLRSFSLLLSYFWGWVIDIPLLIVPDPVIKKIAKLKNYIK